MTVQWKPEQVMALAPDPASAKAGRELAAPRKWASAGRGETLVWGECQGSGKDPYRICIDLTEPAFSCSCPSRKFPCKHGLGLLLMLSQNEAAIQTGSPPEWAAKWAEGRAARAQKRATKAPDEPRDEQAREKRQIRREARVADGITEMERWLADLMRMGLAEAQSKPHGYWANLAARMVDAQAPGLAARLLGMSGVASSGAGWESRLLEECAKLHLLLRAWRNLAVLPDAVQADVRAAIGWTVTQEELSALPSVSSTWNIIGHRIIEEEHLKTQRIWLWSNDLGQEALLLHFMIGAQGPEIGFPAGRSFLGEAVYHPGAFPQRASLRSRQALQPIQRLIGVVSIEEIVAAHGRAAARHPWLRTKAFVLENALAAGEGGVFWLLDPFRKILPLHPGFARAWELMALCGGKPMTVCGEYDGQTAWPLSVLQDGRFVTL